MNRNGSIGNLIEKNYKNHIFKQPIKFWEKWADIGRKFVQDTQSGHKS